MKYNEFKVLYNNEQMKETMNLLFECAKVSKDYSNSFFNDKNVKQLLQQQYNKLK